MREELVAAPIASPNLTPDAPNPTMRDARGDRAAEALEEVLAGMGGGRRARSRLAARHNLLLKMTRLATRLNGKFMRLAPMPHKLLSPSLHRQRRRWQRQR
jgi:hypothetical protein